MGNDDVYKTQTILRKEDFSDNGQEAENNNNDSNIIDMETTPRRAQDYIIDDNFTYNLYNNEYEILVKVNEMVATIDNDMNQARKTLQEFSRVINNTDRLLDLWVNILSQSIYNQQLISNKSWQAERLKRSAVGKFCYICKIERFLDFYVAEMEWGIEILINGIKMKEHHQRFQEDMNKYQIKSRLLIDFRETKRDSNKKTNIKLIDNLEKENINQTENLQIVENKESSGYSSSENIFIVIVQRYKRRKKCNNGENAN
nr:8781_t:CDS:2 [Entrophospora candida]